MQADLVFIGIDVAKAELAVAGMPGVTSAISVPNTRAGIRKWLRSVPAMAKVAMESSGQYHAELATLCHEAGLQVYVLNARDVYFYAKGLGQRAKTDPGDAEVLARYIREHHAHLHAWAPPSEAERQVQELLVRRARVVRHQGAMHASLQPLSTVRRQVAAVDRAIKQLLQAMDAEVTRLIAEDAALSDTRQRLRTVTGIGPQISALLTVLFHRIGFANVDALVAYTGLDPRPSDSGQKRGRRRLTKRGPSLLRRQLWLAAFSASRNALFKPLYQSFRSRGLSATEAMVVLARKLLRIAWAVWRTGQPFDPGKLQMKA